MGKINIKDGIAGETIVSIKSEQDSSGQKIDTTYLKEVSAEGKTLTYTKGDGTTTSDNITLTASDVGADVSGSAESALNSAKTYIDEQITDVSETINNHINDTSNPHGITKKDLNLENVENKSSATIRSEITKDNVTTALGYTPYTPNEVDNKLSALETNIDWKEAVDTFDSIATAYPNPEDGWTVNVKDTDYTYRYNGTSWVAISANSIPKATDTVDGLLSKEDHIKYETAYSNNHIHSNKDVLDNIDSTDITNWDAAKSHADSTHARTDATKVEASSTNGNIKINGTETTVYSHPTGTNPHGTTKTDLGLSKVENKSSADIRGEITKDNVTNALGYTPSESDTTYNIATDTELGLIKSGGDIKVETNGTVSIKDDSHNHIISNIDGLQNALDGKVPTSRTINNKSLSADITLSASDVGADTSGSAVSALTSANEYTDTQISTITSDINAVDDNLTKHIDNSTIHVTNEDKAKIDKGSSHADSAHAPSDAEANVIDTIQVNDVNLTPTNKTVNIKIPTTTSELTNTSGYLTEHQDISGKANKSDLATVATSGSYKDLKNIPTSFAPSSHKHSKSEITDFPTSMTPTAHNQASNTINAMTGYSKASTADAITTSDSLNTAIGKLEKALDSKGTSSFSGSYNDLTNKPTIPTVGNGTITINQNKTKIGEFTTNQSGDTTIDLTDTKYTLPSATSSDLGGVKIGDNISISNGIISISDASTSVKGVVKLDSSINSIATDTAATSSAVKSAYDLADAAMPKSGGTFTGLITLSADPTSNLEAATKQYVDNQISNKIAVADAMVFKGTLGTGGTVTSVPTTKVVKGDTYKIITNGTYSGYTCKIGDLLIALNSGSITANTTNWVHVPSGDEYDSDMVGATSSTVGIHGLVPAPSAGSANRYLRSDGEWSIPPDTTVTSVNNHYTPTSDSGSTLSVDASSTTSASWGSTNLVTGVNIQRDAKGHVTGVTVDSIKMPANPNTDTNTSHSHAAGNGLLKDGNGSTSGTVTYSLKQASSDEIGGIKVSSLNTNSITVNNESDAVGRYYPIELNSDGKAIVNVPWTDINTWKPNTLNSEGYVASGSGQANKVWKTDANGNPDWRDDANTTYSGNSGITIDGTFIKHSNSITAGTAKGDDNKTLSFGGTFTIPTITYDAQGHITSTGTTKMTMPSNYSHPTTSGYKHIPSGGSSGQILRWSADGTATWGNDNNTDVNVTSVLTNPTSSTKYYPTFVTGSTTGSVKYNNGLSYKSLEGTTSKLGYGSLELGNSTTTGNAGNKYGLITLYSKSSGFGYITQTDTTSSISHTLPASGGTILNTGTTSYTQSLTSGTTIGKIKINGNETTIYAPTNTDTKVTNTLATTTKAYVTGTTSSSTNTGTQVFDTGIYLDTTAGRLTANSMNIEDDIYFPNGTPAGYVSVSEIAIDISDILSTGDACTTATYVIANSQSYRGWLPQRCGKFCDGSNDTNIIQDTINALSTRTPRGGKIVLMEGSYTIKSNITIPQGVSVIIEGCGQENTTINFINGAHFILNSTSTTTETTLSLKSLNINSTNQSFDNNEIFVKFSSGKNNLLLDEVSAYVQFGIGCSARYPRLFNGYNTPTSFMTVNNSKFVLNRTSTSLSYNSAVTCIALFDHIDLKMENSSVSTSLGSSLSKGVFYHCNSNITNCTLDVSVENSNFIVMESDYACISNCNIKCAKLCETIGSRGILSNNKIYCYLGGIISFDVINGNHIRLNHSITGRSFMNITNNVWYNNTSTAILTYNTYSVFSGNISRYKMQLDTTPTGSSVSNNIYNSGLSSFSF